MGEQEQGVPADLVPMGAYVATERLYVGTVLAHMPGDPVHYNNIIRNGWVDKVRRIDVDT